MFKIRCVILTGRGSINMGKSFCVSVDDSYPALRANHKNDKKRPKSRVAMKHAKISKFNAESKVKLKLTRIQDDKKITKSRRTKQRLKSKESGIRTAEEEKSASQLADYADQLIHEESSLNKEGTCKIQLNYWDDWEDIESLIMGK